MESETKTFRCVVHITRQVEVFVEAEDECEAEDIVCAMDEYELTCDGNYMDDEPVVKKCTQV